MMNVRYTAPCLEPVNAHETAIIFIVIVIAVTCNNS